MELLALAIPPWVRVWASYVCTGEPHVGLVPTDG
jgi:hypothetical protein